MCVSYFPHSFSFPIHQVHFERTKRKLIVCLNAAQNGINFSDWFQNNYTCDNSDEYCNAINDREWSLKSWVLFNFARIHCKNISILFNWIVQRSKISNRSKTKAHPSNRVISRYEIIVNSSFPFGASKISWTWNRTVKVKRGYHRILQICFEQWQNECLFNNKSGEREEKKSRSRICFAFGGAKVLCVGPSKPSSILLLLFRFVCWFGSLPFSIGVDVGPRQSGRPVYCSDRCVFAATNNNHSQRNDI